LVPPSQEERERLQEVLAKVRRIEIVTRRLVNDVFSGEYHSVFKGQGMEFDEVREYQPGDDVRTIDWNVTARMGSPYVKRFVEERELLVLFLLDVSASGRFGSSGATKLESAAEACAILAFSALSNNDKVGAVLFSSEVEEYIPPDKGRRHVLHVIRKILHHQPRHLGTDIAAALEFLLRVIKKRAIVFLVSDFIAPDFSRALRLAAGKFDLVALEVTDERERSLPRAGLVRVWDQEAGEEAVIDLSSPERRRAFAEVVRRRQEELENLFLRSGTDRIRLAAGEDPVRPLTLFFRRRARRR